MKKSRHLVILFGGGATRGAFKDRVPPPPLEQDFFDVAGQVMGRGTPRLAKRVIKDVFNLYGRVSGVGLEQYFRDIESRAEIGQFAKSRNKPKNWMKRQRGLEELIRRVLLHTTCDLNKSPARVFDSKVHSEILRHVQLGDTIITFNYDTVVEESFPADTQVWNPRDGYGVNVGGLTHEWAKEWRKKHKVSTTAKSRVCLLKLHGSLNWTLYKTKKVRLKQRPYVVQFGRTHKCSILPPGWHKRISVNPYRKLWREARLKLENCSALAIIGYSLPETDLLARALFAEVSRSRAARNQFLDDLYLADPNEVVKSRFVDLFAPALGPKGRVYRYENIEDLNRAWQKRGPRK